MDFHESDARDDGPVARAPLRRRLREVVVSVELMLLLLALVLSLCGGMIYRFFAWQFQFAGALGVTLALALLWLVRVGLLSRDGENLRKQMRLAGLVLAIVIGIHVLDVAYLNLTEKEPNVAWEGSVPRKAFTPADSQLAYRDANLIVISIDTLRADHLGCYGYREDTSPNIDAFARGAVRFSRTYSPAGVTLPSHATMFTSLQPGAHRAEVERESALSDKATTLAEVLHGAGYRTAAVVDGGQISPAWGLNQGFDVYDTRQKEGFRTLLPMALDRLKELKDDKFFLFVHTYDVHTPYAPSEEDVDRFFHHYRGPLQTPITDPMAVAISQRDLPVDSNDVRFVEAAYDAGIYWTDGQVGRLLAGIGELGLDRNTIVVITSDHGEAFGEHGWVALHLYSLFDELLHVPLLVRLPDGALAGSTFDYNTGLVDLMPTLLDLLGVPYDGPMQGRSIAPMLDGSQPAGDHMLFAQNFRYRDDYPDQRSFRQGLYKFIQNSLCWQDRLSTAIGRTKALYTLRGRALYRMESDYDESRNALLIDYRAINAMKAAQWLEDRMREVVRESAELQLPPAAPVQLTPEEREQLRQLGYVNAPSAERQQR